MRKTRVRSSLLSAAKPAPPPAARDQSSIFGGADIATDLCGHGPRRHQQAAYPGENSLAPGASRQPAVVNALKDPGARAGRTMTCSASRLSGLARYRRCHPRAGVRCHGDRANGALGGQHYLPVYRQWREALLRSMGRSGLTPAAVVLLRPGAGESQLSLEHPTLPGCGRQSVCRRLPATGGYPDREYAG